MSFVGFINWGMTLKFGTNKANCNGNQMQEKILSYHVYIKNYFENTKSKNNQRNPKLMPLSWKSVQMK